MAEFLQSGLNNLDIDTSNNTKRVHNELASVTILYDCLALEVIAPLFYGLASINKPQLEDLKAKCFEYHNCIEKK